MDLSTLVRKHVILNAAQYGKAHPNAIIGKVIAEAPDAKRDMRALVQLVNRIVSEVNALDIHTIQEEARQYAQEKPVKEETRKRLIEDGTPGGVITRFAPEPNGYLHIGHAKALFLSLVSAQEWNGSCILRFDDTNPEKESQEFVDAIKEDAAWLGATFSREVYTSDFIPQLYEYAEKLIREGHFYVCTCSQDTIGTLRTAGKPCPCREKPIDQHYSLWKSLVAGEIDDGVIVRLKGDMTSLNTVMRDPTMFRIIRHPHYRQGTKYVLWPTYDFSSSIMDSLIGVTHALRSKEYELRDELYYTIVRLLNLRIPRVYDFSRLELRGYPLSKRVIKPLIENKVMEGWDDPRLPTIRGLRRRGVLPESIKTFVLSFGLSKVESQPEIDTLLIENRKLLDPTTPRYFFVSQPVLLSFTEPLKKTVTIRRHPTKDLGLRHLTVVQDVFIDGSDAASLHVGDLVRLKDLCNVKIFAREKDRLLVSYEGEELIEHTKKIQWVPKERAQKTVLLIPQPLLIMKNGEEISNPETYRRVEGVSEEAVATLPEGSIVQFERVGFARLDRKSHEGCVFIFV